MYITVVTVYAQTHIRIHLKSGEVSDVPIVQIDSVAFVNGEENQSEEAVLKGSWFWGSTEAGYYELLTFIEDKTHTK